MTAPRPADYPTPEIPATLTASADLRARHQTAWQALLAGDSRKAGDGFRTIVRQTPGFYPADAGLGFVMLVGRQYRNAEPRFRAVTAANARYVPGWVGLAEALVGLGQDREAIVALERLLALDPRRDSARTRLEFLRLRVTEATVIRGRRARAAGRLVEARRELEAAFVDAPANTVVIRELVAVEVAANRMAAAEAYARKLVTVEPENGAQHALLGDVLEGQRKYRDAAAAYARAAALDPRPEWRARNLDLREKAEEALLPAGFARLTSAPTVSRSEAAAYIGIHLDHVIAKAPRRATEVATDVRSHWASTWILPVTRAGVMSIYPNHTFQPAAVVRRSDLASITGALVRIATAGRRAELTKWQAARPKFSDVEPAHVSYRAVALAVAAGAMVVDPDGRFAPTRPVSGRELDAVVRRVDAIADF